MGQGCNKYISIFLLREDVLSYNKKDNKNQSHITFVGSAQVLDQRGKALGNSFLYKVKYSILSTPLRREKKESNSVLHVHLKNKLMCFTEQFQECQENW